MIDTELEYTIERAGREDVFALVERQGWQRGCPVPRQVWIGACLTIMQQKTKQNSGRMVPPAEPPKGKTT